MNLCGTLGKCLNHFLLVFAWLDGDVFKMRCRRWQMKLIGGFNVRHLFEQVHQLREIEKLGEAGARPVAGAFGVEFVKILFVDFLN